MKLEPKFTLLDIVTEVLRKHTDFKVSNEDEHEKLLSLIESEGMSLLGLGLVKYSRRPNLIKSYTESGHRPVIITDISQTTICSICEMDVYINNVKQKVYYTSDLRFHKDVKAKTKARLRRAYSDLLNKLDKTCYTAILKSNAKALSSLTSSKSALNYAPYFEYRSDSLIVSPLIRLIQTKNSYDIQCLEKTRLDEYEKFLKQGKSESLFTHGLNSDDDIYVLIFDNQIKGSVRVTRSNSKSILIEPTSFILKSTFKLSNIFFKRDYFQKIPWVYFSELLLSKDLSYSESIRAFVKYLYSEKIVRSGEVCMYSHNYKNLNKIHPLIPQFTNDAIFYRITAESGENVEHKKVILNSLCL